MQSSPDPSTFSSMAQLKMTKWHSYSPSSLPSSSSILSSPVTILPTLQPFPRSSPSPTFPPMMPPPGSLMQYVLHQHHHEPSRTADLPLHLLAAPVNIVLPPLHASPIPQHDDRKRLHASGLMCLVEAAARNPTERESDGNESPSSDSKRHKKVERSDIGSFIHIYNPTEATRRGRPRGRPFAKAAEHARKGKSLPSATGSTVRAPQLPAIGPRNDVNIGSQLRSESESAA